MAAVAFANCTADSATDRAVADPSRAEAVPPSVATTTASPNRAVPPTSNAAATLDPQPADVRPDAPADVFATPAETSPLAPTSPAGAPLPKPALDGVATEVALGTSAERPARATFEFSRPEHVRGLYVNAWSAGSRRRLAQLVDLAQRTEINTFVIDVKDATGYVSHRTDVALAREIGATGEVRIPDLAWTLGRLEAAGIHPVARIVIVKDPILAQARPDLAVQDTAGGPWTDRKGAHWLNPWRREVWEYHVDLAREVAEMGVTEIQWDYVRFPDAPKSALARARFPGADGRPRRRAIRDFLAYSRDELAPLGAQVTADVFGVTTSATADVGIGQVWESFIDVVDVALPMVYPSHYWPGAFGLDRPNAHPYEVVREALEDAVRRSESVAGAGATRPWLQDFTMGQPRYGAAEVRAQIQATYDAGVHEWVLWNPSSRYTEDALEPASGFAQDPLIRVADQVLPASRRFEVLDTVSAAVADPEAKDDLESDAEADEIKAATEPDTTGTAARRPGR